MMGRCYTLKALCPATGEQKFLRLRADDAFHVFENGPRSSFYELRGDDDHSASGSSVQQVLESPTGIFAGMRKLQKGGLCYCGKPRQCWTPEGNKCPPKPGMLFVVYVNPLDYIYEWRWVFADEENPNFPDGFKTRYRELLWPKT